MCGGYVCRCEVHGVAQVIERNTQRNKSRTVQTGDVWHSSPDGRKKGGRVAPSGSG